MKVEKIHVKNLRQIDDLEVTFGGCTAIVTGGNNKGKSTLLKSIIERLRGDTTNIVKEGKSTGECEWTFTDGSVLVRTIKPGSEKMEYVNKDGRKASKIKEICDRLFGKGFDIDAFLSSTPKDQKKKLQELVGIDFEDIDTRYKEAYEDRTYANNILKSEKSKIEGLSKVEVEGEYKDIEHLIETIHNKEKQNEKIEGIEKQMKYKEEEIKKMEMEIEKLKEDIDKGNIWLKSNIKEDIVIMKENIAKQKEINQLHDKNKSFDIMMERVNQAEQEALEKDKVVKTIEEEKLDMIKSAKLPEGFAFTDDGITYNGFELSKSTLSSSQTYIAGLKLASMNMGEVKMLTFDASYLDRDNLNKVGKWSQEEGLQLHIERPDFDGGEIKYEILFSD